MAQLIFPQLVTLDEKQQPVDWAAESHEISADGLTYTFHLHKGMAWADGTPIDATTFAYSINRTLDPCTGPLMSSPTTSMISRAQRRSTPAFAPLGRLRARRR